MCFPALRPLIRRCLQHRHGGELLAGAASDAQGSTYEHSHRLAVNNRCTAWSSSSISFVRYWLMILPIAVVRSVVR